MSGCAALTPAAARGHTAPMSRTTFHFAMHCPATPAQVVAILPECRR